MMNQASRNGRFAVIALLCALLVGCSSTPEAETTPQEVEVTPEEALPPEPPPLDTVCDMEAEPVPDPFPATSFAARDPIYRDHAGRQLTEVEGFRANDTYKDVWMARDLLCGYQKAFPDIARVVHLGDSHQDRPILALRITDNPDQDEDEPAVFLTGGHHGHELLSVDFAFDAIGVLLEQYAGDVQVQRWVNQLDIWVVPMASPDGNWTILRLDAGKKVGRKNGCETNGVAGFQPGSDGVDLNRNYGFKWGALGETGSKSDPTSPYYRGTESGSEPETQAVMELAAEHHFVAALSWHTNGTMILSPYTISGSENPDPDWAWDIALELAEAAGEQPNGRTFVVKSQMYPVDGTDQDWHFHAYGTLCYIIEGSHHNPTKPGTRDDSIAGVRPIFEGLLNRVLDGPTLSGHTRDAQGNPLEAVVTVDEVATHEGERWTSRPLDGRFDRIVPDLDSYTVRATLDGFLDEVRIVPRAELTQGVDLVLTPVRDPVLQPGSSYRQKEIVELRFLFPLALHRYERQPHSLRL